MSNLETERRSSPRLRPRTRLGKYRIEACLDEGEYSNVYRAMDTIEGRRAALKIPHPHLADEEYLHPFRKEVRLSAKIDHPRILGIKDASFIDGKFVMTYPLGVESLSSRLSRRVSADNVKLFMSQALEAIAELHRRRIIHCDIKPENFIVFPGPETETLRSGHRKVRLSDGSGLGFGNPGTYGARTGIRQAVCSLRRVFIRSAALSDVDGKVSRVSI